MDFDNVIAVRDNKKVYRCGDKTIKVFDKSCSKTAILNEARNQAIIECAGLNVPEILGFRLEDGCLVTESQYIDGTTLDVLMKENPERFEEYLKMFVDVQAEFQEKSSVLLTRLRDRYNRQINNAELTATVRFSLHARLSALPKGQHICHGDYNPSNVIVCKHGKAYVLDWSRATQGNPAADAAMTCILFCLDGEAQTAKKYLELYCEKTGATAEEIKKWIPIVAAASSTDVTGEKREKLLSWVESFGLLD